jgi:DNA-binding protein Fis
MVEERTKTLREDVQEAVRIYFSKVGDSLSNDLYELIISEIEQPLLEEVMNQTKGNQTKAAMILGCSRGNLRKKLKRHGIL